jgi:hypothetical protein
LLFFLAEEEDDEDEEGDDEEEEEEEFSLSDIAKQSDKRCVCFVKVKTKRFFVTCFVN